MNINFKDCRKNIICEKMKKMYLQTLQSSIIRVLYYYLILHIINLTLAHL